MSDIRELVSAGNLDTMRGYVGDIVLLEDAPVKNVDTTPATWKENGENFTRSRLGEE